MFYRTSNADPAPSHDSEDKEAVASHSSTSNLDDFHSVGQLSSEHDVETCPSDAPEKFQNRLPMWKYMSESVVRSVEASGMARYVVIATVVTVVLVLIVTLAVLVDGAKGGSSLSSEYNTATSQTMVPSVAPMGIAPQSHIPIWEPFATESPKEPNLSGNNEDDSSLNGPSIWSMSTPSSAPNENNNLHPTVDNFVASPDSYSEESYQPTITLYTVPGSATFFFDEPAPEPGTSPEVQDEIPNGGSDASEPEPHPVNQGGIGQLTLPSLPPLYPVNEDNVSPIHDATTQSGVNQ